MLNKNEAGIKALYANYADSIFGIISRTIKSPELAEEVLQITMLKAWDKIGTYKQDRSSLYTWLAAIARNASIDKIRLKSFSNQQKTDSIEASVYEYGSVSLTQSSLDVKKLLGQLDEKYQAVLRLVYLEGYTQAQVSEKLGVPLGTVKTRIRTALSILRSELKKEKLLFISLLILLTLITLTWI